MVTVLAPRLAVRDEPNDRRTNPAMHSTSTSVLFLTRTMTQVFPAVAAARTPQPRRLCSDIERETAPATRSLAHQHPTEITGTEAARTGNTVASVVDCKTAASADTDQRGRQGRSTALHTWHAQRVRFGTRKADESGTQ